VEREWDTVGFERAVDASTDEGGLEVRFGAVEVACEEARGGCEEGGGWRGECELLG
jgi:hypothetical protein